MTVIPEEPAAAVIVGMKWLNEGSVARYTAYESHPAGPGHILAVVELHVPGPGSQDISMNVISAVSILAEISRGALGWSDHQRTEFVNRVSELMELGVETQLSFSVDADSPRD